MISSTTHIAEGWDVIGSDDQKIGEVTGVAPNYVLLTKGLIFQKDLYVPLDAIETVDQDRGAVYVNAAKDDVDAIGWDREPDGNDVAMSGVESGGSTWADDGVSTATTTAGRSNGDSETLRVPVHEEQLRAGTREVEAGEVQINKGVVEERQEMDIPVTHEEIDVRRVRVDRASDGSDEAFRDNDTIRVPLRAETVEVGKDTRVVEELEISKRPVTETQRVSETVRRETVDVDGQDSAYESSRTSR